MEIDTIASIFVGFSTLVLALVSIMILRRTKEINERLLKIEEVRNVSKMRIVDDEVYFYDGLCYFRFDNCGGVPAYLDRLDLDDISAAAGLNLPEEGPQDVPDVNMIMPPTVFDVGFPLYGMTTDGSDAFLLTVRYRLVDDERCIPSHECFKLSLKERTEDGITVFKAERKDDALIAAVREEKEKRKGN